ncbi:MULTISPECIES: hypothetical protein [Pseudomonas]|jgi:hypothetical protein|uniref:Beta-barrel assembly machine subunit BamE n=2 Tax=Pseudomonas syringae TaxID=317 RepID=A0AB37ZU90_PSESX|nr:MULTISPECIES: hypothetical protein [Pseudomonas]AKF53222.1 hypothetical protein PsyrH_22510 [Pseudomonas syringae pv. syringae HS191]ALE00829.1 hypothetical protein PSYRMG_20170 [Pseudomonas syringae UMAF0158]MBC9745281.1 hypothetical protein [Pseudomonas syringae pv. syringae]MBC9750304.1 hypothetical protein [Pseudomonas syringae pv. syringae]MBI6664769.1 hypothetical protein [Pseudomonas syringae]
MGNYYSLARLKGLAVAITVMAALTACSTGGSNPLGGLDALTGEPKFEPDYIKANIIPKKSTKSQIRAKFGAPNSAEDDVGDNSAQWSYERGESGVAMLKKMAYKYSYKYGAGTSNSVLAQADGHLGDAEDVMDDVSTVTGTKSTGMKKVINRIVILFNGETVDRFYTY